MESSTKSLEERRVAPERVVALVRLEQGLHGRLGRRPAVYGSLVVAAVFVVSIVLGTALGQAVANAAGAEDLSGPAGQLGIDIVGVACVVWLLSQLGWWRAVGFVGPSQWRSLRLLGFPALIAVASVVGGLANVDLSDLGELAFALPQVLATGLWEEGLTRGFLLSALVVSLLRSGRGPVGAVVLSSVIFGLLHLVGVVDTELPAVLVQVVYATFLGIGFAALLLRTNALWLLVVVHAVINAGNALKGDNEAGVFPVILTLSTIPFAIYGLYLLRRVKDPGPGPAAHPT